MSLIFLDFPCAASVSGSMGTAAGYSPSPSSAQLGAAAEILVAGRLMMISGGRLSCYAPLVDDDAVDLLILDKVTGETVGLQIKSRTYKKGEARPRTVQFDVQKPSWREHSRLFLMAVTVDGVSGQTETIWLVPSNKVAEVGGDRQRKWALRPNPRSKSSDRYSPYRLEDMEAVVDRLISHLERIASATG